MIKIQSQMKHVSVLRWDFDSFLKKQKTKKYMNQTISSSFEDPVLNYISDWFRYYPYYPIEFGLEISASIIGLYGAFWVLIQYYKKRILSNTPGLIICLIAILDVLFAIYYLFTAIVHFTLSEMQISMIWAIFDAAFYWNLITYSLY